MYQLRNNRSITSYPVKNLKVNFWYELSIHWAYFETNENLNALKGHLWSLKVIRGHLRSNNEIWKIKLVLTSLLPNLTLKGPK